MKKIICIMSVCSLVVIFISLNGCAPVLLGAGAVVGYLVKKDHVELSVRSDLNKAKEIVRNELKTRGSLTKDYEMDQRLTGVVGKMTLDIRFSYLAKNRTLITIGARKNMVPNIDFATKFASDLEQKFT